jgi:hypothetical protein
MRRLRVLHTRLRGWQIRSTWPRCSSQLPARGATTAVLALARRSVAFWVVGICRLCALSPILLLGLSGLQTLRGHQNCLDLTQGPFHAARERGSVWAKRTPWSVARERELCAPWKHHMESLNPTRSLPCSACSGLASRPRVRLGPRAPPLRTRGAQARARGWRACPRARRTRSRRPRACSTPPATLRPRATALRPPPTPPARGLTFCTTPPCATSAWARWKRLRSSQQARGAPALRRQGPACVLRTCEPSAAALAARHAPGPARGGDEPTAPGRCGGCVRGRARRRPQRPCRGAQPARGRRAQPRSSSRRAGRVGRRACVRGRGRP